MALLGRNPELHGVWFGVMGSAMKGCEFRAGMFPMVYSYVGVCAPDLRRSSEALSPEESKMPCAGLVARSSNLRGRLAWTSCASGRMDGKASPWSSSGGVEAGACPSG
jgi:hypothetical protein